MGRESAEFSDAIAESGKAVAAILLLLVIPLLGSFLPTVGAPVQVEWSETLRIGVNPNTAPWWELTALPGIGESTARNVIAYRESRLDPTAAFKSPLDLEPVPDVGIKTIQRIAPHLRFDPSQAVSRP